MRNSTRRKRYHSLVVSRSALVNNRHIDTERSRRRIVTNALGVATRIVVGMLDLGAFEMQEAGCRLQATGTEFRTCYGGGNRFGGTSTDRDAA